MSGNSSRSRRTTSPIRSRRSRAGFWGVVAFTGVRSALHEGQAVLADLQLVAVLELGTVDSLAVDERPVERPLVLDEEPALALDEHCMVARDGDVVEEDVAVGRAADARAPRPGPERLAGAAAARADDERGPLEGLDGALAEIDDLLGRERLRRLGRRRLALLEQRAAARAVVRRLRVLEPALLAVDVRHASGAAFPVRMSVSRATSTSSSTLRGPDFWSRATSSARRMSILPCRIRRR